MNIIHLHIGEGFRGTKFELIITERSDKAAINQITANVNEQTDDLERTVEQTTPKTP